VDLFAALTIGLIALIVTPGHLFYYDVTPKIAVLLVGTSAMLLWPRGKGAVGAPRALALLVVASLCSLAVSTALSSDPALSAFGTNWRRFGAVTQAAVLIFTWLIARHVAARPERARTILRGVAASGAVAALYGIGQYFGWDPILPAAGYHIGEGIWTIVRPPGTLGYVSYFATWLLAVVFLSLGLAQWETKVRLRYAAFAAAALAAVAILLTGTRAAMLGLAAGIAVWLWRRGFRISKRVAAGIAVLLLAVVAFYYSPAGWPLRSRTRWFVEDPWGGARIELWRDSLAMASHRLPLGYGPEVYTAEFPRFESKSLARAYPDFLHESPHNIFLDALVSQGIPGFAILCAFCFLGLRAAWRLKHPGAAWLAAGVAAAIVSQQFTVFTMPTALALYLMIAVALALEGGSRARATWVAVVVPLLYVAARLVMADHQLALASQAVARDDVTASAAHYGSYDKLRFPGTGSDLWYSRACSDLAARTRSPIVRIQAMAQAGAAALRATRTSEEPFNAWYNLSALYAAQNDFADTEKSLRAAIAARPNWFKPHWTLAQVLRLERRMPEARQEAELAVDLNGGKHPEVVQTLNEIRGPQPW
jgi:O-antigen ligase